jgi:hypothetical protein
VSGTNYGYVCRVGTQSMELGKLNAYESPGIIVVYADSAQEAREKAAPTLGVPAHDVIAERMEGE